MSERETLLKILDETLCPTQKYRYKNQLKRLGFNFEREFDDGTDYAYSPKRIREGGILPRLRNIKDSG